MKYNLFLLSLVFGIAVTSLLKPVHADLIYVGGHADLGVGFDAGNLHLHIHAEEDLTLYGGGTMPAGEIDPADLAIGVPGSSVARPAGAEWSFLASGAGQQIWFLPQSSDPNKPFLGMGTEELLPADGWTLPITWQLNSVTVISGNPTAFSIWQNDAFLGPQVFASTLVPTNGSQNPLRTGNSWQQNTFAHDHFNYGFTGEGVYDVSFTVSGRNTTLAQDFTDTATFRFYTGSAISAVPEPGSMTLLGASGAVGLLWRKLRGRKTTKCVG